MELYFHGDDYETIKKNEMKDSYYYGRRMEYKTPVFSGICGGLHSGKVKFQMYFRHPVLE